MNDERHRELLAEALEREAEGQRRLLAGDEDGARDELRLASDRYRASWEAAPPGAYGRLVGMIKAAVLAGDAQTAAAYVHAAVEDPPPSPTSGYALAIAGLVHGDDGMAARAAEAMRGGSEAFDRTADAILALAERDGTAYADALDAIVADFAGRADHLTGVPIADTAAMLERIAEARGLAARPSSPLLP